MIETCDQYLSDDGSLTGDSSLLPELVTQMVQHTCSSQLEEGY